MFCVTFTVFSLGRSQTVQPVLRVRVGKTLVLESVMKISLLGLRLLIRVSLNIFMRKKKKYLSFTDLNNFELVLNSKDSRFHPDSYSV